LPCSGITVAINGSRPRANHHPATMPASPFASRGSERPIQMERPSTPPREILPGQQGRTPSQPARRLRLRGRLTRATTDSHRAALLTRHASSASTPLQPLAAPQSRLVIRPLAAKRSPATISISIASRVEFARLRKRRACLLSWGQRTRGTRISLVLRNRGERILFRLAGGLSGRMKILGTAEVTAGWMR
jgi:hypothetical protein